MQIENNRLQRFYTYCTLGLLTLAAYIPCLKAGFTNWDDDVYVTANSVIRDLSWENTVRMFTHLHSGLYKPLVMLSFAIEYHFAGLNPVVFHATNLAFHIINALLVCSLVERLGKNLTAGLCAGLLFAIHPMHVESVAWIAERKDMLYSFFFLTSLCGYLNWRGSRSRADYAISLVSFVLSLVSKPMGVMLPLVLLLSDYTQGRRDIRDMIKDKVPYIALAAVFFVTALFTINSNHVLFQRAGYTAVDNFFMAFHGLALYTLRLVFPFGLAAIYPYPEKTGAMLPFIYYLAFPACTLFYGWLLWRFRRDRNIMFGLVFFLLTILPGLQWIPLTPTIAFDHYSYIPYIGPFYVMGLFVARTLEIGGDFTRKFITAVFASMCLFLGVLSWQRCAVWQNSMTLWTDMEAKYPGQAITLANISAEHFRQGDYRQALEMIDKAIAAKPNDPHNYLARAATYMETGDTVMAMRDFEAALSISPDYPEALAARGAVYAGQGHFDEAIADFRRAVLAKPSFDGAHLNLGAALIKSGKAEEGLRELNRALELNPTYTDALFNRASVYMAKGMLREAISDFQRAASMEPHRSDLRAALGRANLAAGRLELAEGDFSAALSTGKPSPELFGGRGTALMLMGRCAEAEKDFSLAIASNPATAYYAGRAACEIMRGDNVPALNDLDRAISLSPRESSLYNNRAVAYEGLGREDKAMSDYETALKLSPGSIKARLGKASLLMKKGDAGRACAELAKLPQSADAEIAAKDIRKRCRK